MALKARAVMLGASNLVHAFAIKLQCSLTFKKIIFCTKINDIDTRLRLPTSYLGDGLFLMGPGSFSATTKLLLTEHYCAERAILHVSTDVVETLQTCRSHA